MKYFFTSTFKSQRTAPFGNTPISFFFSLSLNISCLSFFKKKNRNKCASSLPISQVKSEKVGGVKSVGAATPAYKYSRYQL